MTQPEKARRVWRGRPNFVRPVSYRAEQSPDQRRATFLISRRADALKRRQCSLLHFWQTCRKPLCRRNRACCGDMHACFAANWRALPEEDREWARGLFRAMAQCLPPQAQLAAAQAARERSLAVRREAAEQEAAVAARPAAADRDAGPPDACVSAGLPRGPRVRIL